MHFKLTTTYHQPYPLRWTCRRDLDRWIVAFRFYFTRKAHLAEKVAARLCQANDMATVRNILPPLAAVDPLVEANDKFFASRRLSSFVEDRLVLIKEFGILPDAADLFLTACPVGCSDCFIESSNDGYDQSLCYYSDDQAPSANVEEFIEHQYASAKGQTLEGAALTGRIGEYLPPRLLAPLFKFLSWDFSPDVDGNDRIDTGAYITRIGWVEDYELGSVECFSLPITAGPIWSRDEVFCQTLKQLLQTRDLDQRPVMVFNNRPQQLVKLDRVFTSLGFVVMRSKIVPLFVTGSRLSLADTVVEAATFNPLASDIMLDPQNEALSTIWTLLKLTSQHPVPERPVFKSLPNNWMVTD
jgi:hypothetical protein